VVSTAALAFTKRVQAAAGSSVTTGYSAGSVRSYGIGTNAGTFALSGQVAVLKRVLAPLSAKCRQLCTDWTKRCIQRRHER